MTQENRAQFQQAQGIDERMQVLQNLQRIINPFQEDERLRVIGLTNFYLRMVDPPFDYVQSAAAGLVRLPFSNLLLLDMATYDAGDNPSRYFARHGVVINDIDKIRQGISNGGELIHGIVHKYDRVTGELGWGEELDQKVIAEDVFEKIQISNGERAIRRAVEQVRNESNTRRRYRMGLNLKGQVLGYINSFSIFFNRPYDRDNPIDPTWENLSRRYHDLNTTIELQNGGSISGDFGVEEAVDMAQAAITRHPFETRLTKLASRDKERFNQLRLQFGAKAANLMILSEYVDDLNRLRKVNPYDGVEIAVPEFQTVPVSYYRDWKVGKLMDEELLHYFEWVNGLVDDNSRYSDEPDPAPYIVRSSAVFSEDGESVTGAGIYESVKLEGGSTFQDFRDAVSRVYTSTNSPRALEYRSQHGIDEEEMGIVIQKYVVPSHNHLNNQSDEGYINSRLPGVPQLMEIVTGTSRNFIRRSELDLFLAMPAGRNRDTFRSVHHFLPDQYKIDPALPIRAAQLAYVVERIWGGYDIQVEFVADGKTINFVQVRELPSSLAQTPEIEFPDEQPFHTGASIGVCDMELPILDEDRDNSERTGAVVFMGNDGWTMGNNTIHLPKEGAVVIYNEDGKNGHIQTLCSEKGLICIFPDVNKEEDYSPRYHQLSDLKRARIVSNGIEGRVYKVQD